MIGGMRQHIRYMKKELMNNDARSKFNMKQKDLDLEDYEAMTQIYSSLRHKSEANIKRKKDTPLQ